MTYTPLEFTDLAEGVFKSVDGDLKYVISNRGTAHWYLMIKTERDSQHRARLIVDGPEFAKQIAEYYRILTNKELHVDGDSPFSRITVASIFAAEYGSNFESASRAIDAGRGYGQALH